MKSHVFPFVGLVFALLSAQAVAQTSGVAGSRHDFSLAYWNTSRGVCTPCHSAHNTDPSQLVPLWSHGTTTVTFNVYTSPTMQAVEKGQQPTGASRACLSCHDGTVALNQTYSGSFIGGTPEYIEGIGDIGTDLHEAHPISFTYDDALAAADGFLFPPSSTLLPWTPGTGLSGKTIAQALLVNGKMECSSCHDVHRKVGSAPTSSLLLKIDGSDANGRRSLICRTCHNK